MRIRNAVVTGGSRGLGRALALELGRRGARVAVVARGEEDLAETVAALRARGTDGVGIAADVATDAARVAFEAQHALGEIDAVFHNASTLGPVPLRPLLDLDGDALAAVLEVNVVGPHRLSRALVGPMVLRGEGLLVAISSDAAQNRYPGWGAYGASKAAHDHLVGTLAAELDGTGVRMISVDPGEMDTEMHAAALPDADRAALARPEDVARRLLDRVLEAPSGARLEV